MTVDLNIFAGLMNVGRMCLDLSLSTFTRDESYSEKYRPLQVLPDHNFLRRVL